MAAWRALGIGISSVAVIVGSLAYLLILSRQPEWTATASATASTRFKNPHRHFHAPARNPWAELDEVEASQIYTFLYDNVNPLNISRDRRFGARGPDSNQIYLVELLRPNKSDVVECLDHNAPFPDRWARVANFETDGEDAFIVDYMVGPLPPSNATQILPLKYNRNSGRDRVQTPVSNAGALMDWVLSIGENASDITQDLLGAVTNSDDPSDPDALVMGTRPVLIEGSHMVHWLGFYGPGIKSDARSLLPQGLYVKLHFPNGRRKSWTIGEWSYNGVLYENDTALRAAMASPDFERLKINLDGAWTDTEVFDTTTRERDMLPPLSIQPYGPRYHLDRSNNYLSWMGFSFYLTTTQATGLSLFDIRYNSSRIIYELGLQEALAHYAGTDPMQSGLEFLDTFFGLGSMMFSLVPGMDCPAYAEYIDMSYHEGGEMFTNRNAICVFEYTSDAPLQRHTSDSSVTVSRNTYLVVRSVSTVGNYDYTIDYIFYLDGSIEVKLRASGFIFGAFHAEPRHDSHSSSSLPRHDPSTNEYGYRIHPGVQTSMHDHVVSFRADLDICGTSNTFVRTAVVPHSQTYNSDKPEIPSARNTMHMTHTPVTHETGLNWPRNSGEMYLITATGVNSTSTNKWGETRSYRILPGTGISNPIHLTIENSTALLASAAWSTHDLWVLRNHPTTEPSSAHHLNYLSPSSPLVDFARMVDDREEIEGEDLVVYFNLGGHHVPTAQDVPNTLMHTSASSVLFVPFNYFDGDVSLAVRQGVRVDRELRRPSGRRERGGGKEGGDGGDGGKDEVRRSSGPSTTRGSADEDDIKSKGKGKHKSPKAKAKLPSSSYSDGDGDADGISYFGARYTSPVTLAIQDLTPDLSHYMQEQEPVDAEDDAAEIKTTWRNVQNHVGGGLFGLFSGKRRVSDRDSDGKEKEARRRFDW